VKCPRLSAQTLTFTVVDYLKLPTFQARRITANAVIIIYPRKSYRHPALREFELWSSLLLPGRVDVSITLFSLSRSLALACRLWRLGDIMSQRYKEGSEIQNKNMFFLIISLSIN
jgi:hypothetical protein